MKLDTDKMLAEKDGATGWITFNNPERRNAMSLEMWAGLETALAAFEEDPEIRAIVMKGAGDKAFVSGPTSRSSPRSARMPKRRPPMPRRPRVPAASSPRSPSR